MEASEASGEVKIRKAEVTERRKEKRVKTDRAVDREGS